jgi:hypothetical protein
MKEARVLSSIDTHEACQYGMRPSIEPDASLICPTGDRSTNAINANTAVRDKDKQQRLPTFRRRRVHQFMAFLGLEDQPCDHEGDRHSRHYKEGGVAIPSTIHASPLSSLWPLRFARTSGLSLSHISLKVADAQ